MWSPHRRVSRLTMLIPGAALPQAALTLRPSSWQRVGLRRLPICLLTTRRTEPRPPRSGPSIGGIWCMHLAHRIDPGRVSRRGKLDLIERYFADHRSKRHRPEVSHENASHSSRLSNGLSSKQLTGGCKRCNARCDVDGRSEEIACSGDNRSMVQPGPSER